MSKNRNNKILAALAVIGASVAAGIAIFSKYKKINQELNDEEFEDDDLDTLDFEEINKDLPDREYVSIKINSNSGKNSSS